MKKATSTLFILATLILAPVYPAQAQKQAAIPRMGLLYLGAPPNAILDGFMQGMRELGYIEGKNIIIEYRFAEGKEDRLPELATELVRLKVDAIFTAGTPALFALKQATKTIPIVFFSTSDPVGTGVVASLAHPGGNVTGISALASDLWPKRLELLKEISPKLSRVAMLWNKNNAGMALEARATQEVAGPLAVALQDRGVKDPNELEVVFAVMTKDRPDAMALAQITNATPRPARSSARSKRRDSGLGDVDPLRQDVDLRYDAAHRTPDTKRCVADRGKRSTRVRREGGCDADSAHHTKQIRATTLHHERSRKVLAVK